MMDNAEALWSAVDDYVVSSLGGSDSVLTAVLEESERAGLPAIAVSETQGRFLQIMARLIGAQRILEIGTLGGYSTICLARGMMPGGHVTTLEISADHAAVAASNIRKAGFEGAVTIRLGPAAETLAALAEEAAGPFDLVFIDADKAGIPVYFDRALKLSRPGAAIIVDNVVRKGQLVDGESDDANVRGVRRLHELIPSLGVTATTIQTVGAKGYDGFLIAIAGG
jgi:predicted O-methyltransferase YrrM